MSQSVCVPRSRQLGHGAVSRAGAERGEHHPHLGSQRRAVAEEINGERRNTKYLPGVELAPFGATTEISDAVADAGVIVRFD